MRVFPIGKAALISTGIIAIALLGACADPPTSPEPVVVPPPTPPSEPVLSWLEMDGPEVVALQETGEFSLRARLSDGTFRDITTDAEWFTSSDHLTIEGPGLARGRTAGDTRVQVRFQGRHAEKAVIVLPSGTYKLTGRVVEEGFPEGGVAHAAVQVTTGLGAGRISATTSEYGYYNLYGVAGPTTLRVLKEGYERVGQTIDIRDHQHVVMSVRPLAPRREIAGAYTLTIRASRECGVGLGKGNLPEEAHVRQYAAAVDQDGPSVWVTLSAETFGSGGAAFSGRVEPGQVVFDLYWTGVEPHVLAEPLGPSRWFLVDGVAVIKDSSSGLSGTLAGELLVKDQLDEVPIASCGSLRHEFSLTR
jgi:hypothetical protein